MTASSSDTPRIDMWFDFASPYSYLAIERIDSLARGAGVTFVDETRGGVVPAPLVAAVEAGAHHGFAGRTTGADGRDDPGRRQFIERYDGAAPCCDGAP